MFTGFTAETIQFFLDLKFNNNTSFFHAQHDKYIEFVQKPFYDLIDGLSEEMRRIDSRMEVRPYKCLSHIHRDTRFTRDKSPYRDHLWFLFRREAEPREKALFYYFEMGPDRLGWGIGFWGENREALDMFRNRIRSNPDEILRTIQRLKLRENGLILNGTVHKRMIIPDNIPEPLRRWYSSKEIYIEKEHPEYKMIFSDKIMKEVLKDYQALSPLYRLFRGYCDSPE